MLNALNPLYYLSRCYWLTRGEKRLYQAKLPVVGVGALTLGGAGKTPFTRYLAFELHRRTRLIPGLVCRNYKAASPYPGVVKDTQLASLLAFGDESLIYRRSLPSDWPVLSGPRKWQTVQAWEQGGICLEAYQNPHYWLIDDALAHQALGGRRCDIVLIRADTPPESWLWFFPFGEARLPVQQLKKAQHIVVTRANLVTQVEREKITRLVQRRMHEGSSIWFAHYTENWPEIESRQELIFVSSLAHNKKFLKQARFIYGSRLSQSYMLRDHELPSWSLISHIQKELKKGCKLLVSEKDYVKWSPWVKADKILLVNLQVEMEQADEFFASIQRFCVSPT
ncbi:MAG: tetraacyldisaccharide 4'-kinase [Bdellovibrionaceae bacterium]|nr:tetraacyldisaccharide 4'-kinase [Pseudobdellovibrionaceae bacterium]